jgi:hypothetical protein
MSYSFSYYALLGVGVFGFLASSYKLYNLVFGRDNLKDKSVIDDSRHLSISDKNNDKVDPVRFALKALAKLRIQMEEYLLEKSPNIHKLRRSFVLTSEEDYEVTCHKIIMLKNEAFRLFIGKLNEGSVFSYDEIIEVTKTIPYLEMENRILRYMNLNVETTLSKNEVTECFGFYSSKYIELMKEEINFIQKNSLNKNKDYLNYRLSILKFRAEDILFIRYGLTELQLKTLVYRFNLDQEDNIRKSIYDIMKNEDYYLFN